MISQCTHDVVRPLTQFPNQLTATKKKSFHCVETLDRGFVNSRDSWKCVEWGTDRRNRCYANEQLENWARNYEADPQVGGTNDLLSFRLLKKHYVIWCDISLHKHDKLNYRKLRITEIAESQLERSQDMQTYRWGQCWFVTIIKWLLKAFWLNKKQSHGPKRRS